MTLIAVVKSKYHHRGICAENKKKLAQRPASGRAAREPRTADARPPASCCFRAVPGTTRCGFPYSNRCCVTIHKHALKSKQYFNNRLRNIKSIDMPTTSVKVAAIVVFLYTTVAGITTEVSNVAG